MFKAAKIIIGTIFAILGILVIGAYGLNQGWHISAMSMDELTDLLVADMRILKPDGPGPFPAVVQFHGCAGVGQAQSDYAELVLRSNRVAVIVDSITPRGMSSDQAIDRVCSGRDLWGAERAGDVLAAIDHVRTLSYVKTDQIVIAGWSHGAWAIMDLLSMDLEEVRPHNLDDLNTEGLEAIRGVVLFYPYCGLVSRSERYGWASNLPTLMILAGKDETIDNDDCLVARNKLIANGADVDLIVFDGVTHAFDQPDLRPGSPQRFDSAVTAVAQARFMEFVSAQTHTP